MQALCIAGVLFAGSTLSVSGDDPKYPVCDIPEALTENVHVVVREDETTFTIRAKDKATLHIHFVATIFNSSGNHFAREQISYSKLERINYLKASVYDKQGNLIKKIRNKEVVDKSMYDEALYSDNRLKVIDLSQTTYPYTVEFEYEIAYKYLYNIPGASLFYDEKVSCQHLVYRLIYPPALAPRYKPVGVSKEPITESIDDGLESMSWSFENIKPIIHEPFGPEPYEHVPHIMMAPTHFEYGGYEGSMETWEAYGHWIALLNKNRDKLLPETAHKIKQLTEGPATREEKIRAVYQYLQNKTRYVNISFGIGGLQPFAASVVDKTSYGDCKALSNYMVALLKTIGVKAYYATVMAGSGVPELQVDFPSHQANHALVAVPNGQDTIWLECTSQSVPFGYLGSSAGDRKALLITEEGGKVVNTTHYPETTNIQTRSADIYLDLSGNAKAIVNTRYSGLEYENDNLNFVLNDRYDEQRKWILRHTSIPSFDVNSFRFKDRKERLPEAEVSLDLNLRRLASISGKRMFLTPNLMNRSTFIPPEMNERKTDVIQRYGYIHHDTIKYHLPEELAAEFLPLPVEIMSRFGAYNASFSVTDGLLVYVRKMNIHNGRFPAESYNELVDFFRRVNKADNTKLVFLKETQ